MFASEPTTHAAFLVDDAGAIVTWNQGCEDLFALRAASILNHPVGALLTDASAAKLARHWPFAADAARVAAAAGPGRPARRQHGPTPN